MDRLDFFQFDFQLHRGFDDSTKAAAPTEVYQTMACLLRENFDLRRLLSPISWSLTACSPATTDWKA